MQAKHGWDLAREYDIQQRMAAALAHEHDLGLSTMIV